MTLHRAASGSPDLVVVGAASRDVALDDPRGWRLGGGVCYSALITARLGLRTAALVGADELASGAAELDLMHEAGVDVRLAALAKGPVFENIERPQGRLQIAHQPSDPIPVDALPAEWRLARGWILTPVAAELPAGWASVPASDAIVAVGWQGILRELEAGAEVRHVSPAPHPIVSRGDVVGLSRDDVAPDLPMAQLYGALRHGATLALTQGDRGALVAHGLEGGRLHLRHSPAIRSHGPADATGAGDVFLAALAAARVEPRLVGGRLAQGLDLLLAAAAASLVIEGPGLLGVPTREAVQRRMAQGLVAMRAGAPRPGA